MWNYSDPGPGEIIRGQVILTLPCVVGNIPRFRLDIEEETSTLLKFDIVDLDSQMQDELRESIRREGKVLYEKV